MSRRSGSFRRGTWLSHVGGNVFVLLSGYLAMVGLIALVLATAQGARFSLGTVLVVALAGWLAAYQVPLSIGGAVLTPLPLLPTLLIVLLIAATASRMVRRAESDGRGGPFPAVDSAYSVVLVMALTHAVLGAGIALLLGCASALDASVYCAAGATFAATAGVARRCGLLDWLRECVPTEVQAGLRSGLRGLAAIAGVGLLVLGAGLIAAVSRVGTALSQGSVGDAFGRSLLSIAYLPNAVFAAWSFVAGPGFSLGAFTLRPSQLTLAPIPDLPLFAILPRHGPDPWWAMVYLLPLIVGVVVGWSGKSNTTPLRRLGVVGVASAVTALGILLLAGLAGGRLGGGAFDPLTLHPGLLAAVTFCWIGLPASAVAWFAGRFAGILPHEREAEELDDGQLDVDWFDEESLDEDSLDGDSVDDDSGERVEISAETVEEINSIEFDT